MIALSFDGVVKRFGRRVALDGLSFEVPRGVIAGFVGQNGAGKTTAFSVISGFLQPDAGRVDVLGRGPFDPRRMKGLVGVLPQDAELPDRHTPVELLRHLARLQGMSGAAARVEVDRVVEAVLLGDRRDSRIATLSHGMRRRVAIASAILGSPALVLLDEPLSGLDPLQARAVRGVLARLRGRSTLVVSSHDLGDLERTCDWVIMLRDGRCSRQGPIAEVTEQRRVVHWHLAGPAPLARLRATLPDQTFTESEGGLVHVAPEGATDAAVDGATVAIMEVLVAERVAVRAIHRGVGLEERFLGEG